MALPALMAVPGCATGEVSSARPDAGRGSASAGRPSGRPSGSVRHAGMLPVTRPVTAPVEPPWVRLAGVEQPSLRVAMNRAQAGDRLDLGPGVHAGPIDAAVSLTLLAAEGATIEATTPYCLRVRAGSEVTVQGVTLRAQGIQRPDAEATVIVVDATARLLDCTISAARAGALSVYTGRLELSNTDVSSETWQTCIVLANDTEGTIRGGSIESRGTPGSGIELWRSKLDIEGSSLSAMGPAVAVTDGSELMARECTLKGRYGLWSTAGAKSGLFDCRVELCTSAGLRVEGSVEAERTRITRSEAGVLLVGPRAWLTLRSSQLTSNTTNVVFEDATAEQLDTVETEL